MLTSTPEFKAVLRMLHDRGREMTPDELLYHLTRGSKDRVDKYCKRLSKNPALLRWFIGVIDERNAESE